MSINHTLLLLLVLSPCIFTGVAFIYVIYKMNKDCKGDYLDDCQPDWSQAPEWANYHLTFDDVRGIWLEVYPEINGNSFANNGKLMIAPSFGYKGDWRGSLRKRP